MGGDTLTLNRLGSSSYIWAFSMREAVFSTSWMSPPAVKWRDSHIPSVSGLTTSSLTALSSWTFSDTRPNAAAPGGMFPSVVVIAMYSEARADACSIHWPASQWRP